MSTISYITLYYALVTHFSESPKAIKNLITSILSSAVIVSFYAILEHFGIDKNIWIQDVQNRVFSSLGQPNWLSAFLIALLPLSMVQIFSSKENNTRVLHVGLTVLFLIAIVFTKSQSGIAATVIVLLSYFVVAAIQKKKSWILLSLIPLAVLVMVFKGAAVDQTLSSLNKINPFYSNTMAIITEENKTRVGGSDSMTIRRVVWEGAIKLGLEHPLFGTGVETFGYSYYWVRPAAHNLTSENDFLYNKAHNEYLNFLATCGFVGLFTYLFLIGAILYLFLNKKIDHNDLRLPLLLGFISILITNYFGFSVVNIALFFFLFPAIYISSIGKSTIKSLKFNIDSTIGILIVLSLALWAILGLRRAWLADIAYTNGRSSLEESENSVKLNPTEPVYYAQLGNIAALVATEYIAPQIEKLPATTSAEIKAQANAYLDKYVNEAIDNVNKAETLNPFNINVLKTKAKTDITLAALDPKFLQDALTSLLKITELSPTESSNFMNVGVLYENLGKKDLAKLAFEKALELKPDNDQARDYLSKLK